MRRLALVALVLFSCAPSHTQPATPAAGPTLKLTFHSGAVYRFSLHSVQSLAGGTAPAFTVDFSATETATVKSVDAGGVANVGVGLSNVVVNSGGGSSPGSATDTSRPAFDVKIAQDGRILSMDGPAMASKFPFRTGFDANLIVAVLPDKNVVPGDSWTKGYDQVNPFGVSSGTIHIQSASKYLRNESINGVNAAVVETTSEATIDTTMSFGGTPTSGAYPLLPGGVTGFALTGTTSTDVTTWIDPRSHGILKTHITAKTNASIGTVVAPGAPTPATGPLSSQADESVDLVLI